MDESGRDHVEAMSLESTAVVRSRRPRALWAVLAVVAVATGALVVRSASDDGGPRPGLPVALGSAPAPMAAEAAADSMMAWITYVAGDDLPALGGEAPAYRLAGDVSEAQVRALADALGVDGDVVQDGPAWRVTGPDGTLEVYEGAGAQWWYSSAVSLDGGGSSSSPGSSGSGGGCGSTDDVQVDCATPTTYSDCSATDGVGCFPADCDPGGDCAVPLPAPVDLPGEEEARSIALDLLARTGMDVDDAVVTVEGPFEAWYVMVEPRLDGVPSGLFANVSVGSGGEVTTAGGYLGTPERLGDYPRLDTRATIDRANAQMAVPFGDTSTGMGIAESAARSPYPPDAPAIAPCDPDGEPEDSASPTCGTASEPTTTTVNVLGCKPQPDGREICEPIEPGIACPQVAAPADEPLGAPETIECTPPPEPGDEPIPLPEPQPMEVVLVAAEPSLVLLGAIDGSPDAYLVPGYRFTDEQDGRVDLPAVDDASLTGPPATETTLPPEPVDPGPDVVDPVDPCEVAVEDDGSGTTHTVQPNPDCVPPVPPAETEQTTTTATASEPTAGSGPEGTSNSPG